MTIKKITDKMLEKAFGTKRRRTPEQIRQRRRELLEKGNELRDEMAEVYHELAVMQHECTHPNRPTWNDSGYGRDPHLQVPCPDCGKSW